MAFNVRTCYTLMAVKLIFEQNLQKSGISAYVQPHSFAIKCPVTLSEIPISNTIPNTVLILLTIVVVWFYTVCTILISSQRDSLLGTRNCT